MRGTLAFYNRQEEIYHEIPYLNNLPGNCTCHPVYPDIFSASPERKLHANIRQTRYG